MADPRASAEPAPADPPVEEPVPGSAGPLTRVVEHLPDGRRLTLYRSPPRPEAPRR